MTQESAYLYSPVLLTLGNLFAVLLIGARVGTGGMPSIERKKKEPATSGLIPAGNWLQFWKESCDR